MRHFRPFYINTSKHFSNSLRYLSVMNTKTSEFHGLKLRAHCGGGAYGDVFYCEDISGHRMAVKIVSKRKLGDSWFRELKGLINYRKITENSPELLQIFHVEEDEEYFFYTMEAADSISEQEYRPDTLASRLFRGPLPQNEVFGILSAIFIGIKTIHHAGFAHRDIKPDNILFVKGIPKLGDIGLMSALSTTTTQVAGTIDFLPPEVRTADGSDSSSKKSTQENDLYAFGKVIYCAVTGQSPQAWPTIPQKLPLTLPFKLFLRLSLRLCDKDPSRRIHSIKELEKELFEIKRKLETGETLRDKAAYQIKQFLLGLRSAGVHFCSFLRKHWLLSIVFLALASSAIWYFSPKPEFDISKQKTVVYTNDKFGISMTVPAQWDILSEETVTKLREQSKNEIDGLTELERKRRERFIDTYEEDRESIYLDYEETPQDNISIIDSPDSEIYFLMNPDEIRFIAKEGAKQWGIETNYYEINKTTFKGVPCVYLDYSVDDKIRINSYALILNGKYVVINCTCSQERYIERKKQFAQVLDTVKFTKNGDSVSKTDSIK